jgi:hypothetical protein
MYIADLVSVINRIMSLNTKCLFHTLSSFVPYMDKQNKNKSMKLSQHVNEILNFITLFNTC